MIIDFHIHTFPDEIAARAVPALAAEAGVPAYTDGTCNGVRASMRRAGIDLSCIMPIATKPSQSRAINAWAAQVNRQYDDLISFGTLHPDQEDWAEEIARVEELGLPGIKLHPDYQGFFVDEARLLPIYRALAAAGRILLLHAGVDIGLPPPTHCTPARLARVLDAVPELTIVAAHMGGYALWDEVETHLLGRDLYFDTSYTLADLGPARLAALIRAHGIERVVFGSDSPWADQADEVAGMRALELTDVELAEVFAGTAARLLSLQCPAATP
jgi:predicted TIM-barrel fold metal-dependent hydrolase